MAALGTSVRVPRHRDSGHGAAVLAACATVGTTFTEAVARFTGAGEVIDPDDDLVRVMAERYAVLETALDRRTAS